MRIETVYFRDFPPFADAQLTFPKVETPGKGELHLLVGQNGTGKTRLLSLLAAALGNRFEHPAATSPAHPEAAKTAFVPKRHLSAGFYLASFRSSTFTQIYQDAPLARVRGNVTP